MKGLESDKMGHLCFFPLDQPLINIPTSFQITGIDLPSPLSMKAVSSLQERLEGLNGLNHNFGLGLGSEGPAIGKMFGVLVVEHPTLGLGYLSAFSGKIGNSNEHLGFVPPIFDSLDESSFLNQGMRELGTINERIRELQDSGKADRSILDSLKNHRKEHSKQLQQRLFDQYHFLNILGESKSLSEIFKVIGAKNPPTAAGECAAPKLLDHAFKHGQRPIALVEFWWGASSRSEACVHKQFYAPCKDKCGPILEHMLKGLT